MKIDGKEKAIAGLIGAILLLAGFGGNALLTDNEFQNAYVCSVTEELGIFAGGISGTAYTGYPHIEDRTGPVRCKTSDGMKGIWIGLEEYAKSKGIDPLSFLIQSETETSGNTNPTRDGIQYSCSPSGCTKIR